MISRSAVATEAARRLWAADRDPPDGVVANVNRVCVQLRAILARWIGSAGYRALLDRALELSRTDHRVLRGLSCQGGEEEAIVAAVKAHGSAQVEADIVGLVATLIDLLGRIVGLEMAVQLVEQGQITGPLAQQPEATGPGPGSESGISGEHDG